MHDNPKTGIDRRRSPRVDIKARVEFFVDADIIDATSVDISETGIRFQTDSPIAINLRMTIDGEVKEKRAKLVWAQRTDGHVQYGLDFTDGESETAKEF